MCYVAVEKCELWVVGVKVRVSILNNDGKTTVKYNVYIYELMLSSLLVVALRCCVLFYVFFALLAVFVYGCRTKTCQTTRNE